MKTMSERLRERCPVLAGVKAMPEASRKTVASQSPVRPPGYEWACREEIPKAVIEKINTVTIPNSQWPLFLCGKPGTGKTSTAAVLFGRIKAMTDRMPMWHRCDDLLMSIATGRTSGVQIEFRNREQELIRQTVSYNAYVERVSKSSCLFLDDLGARKPSEGMYAALFDLLEWRQGKPLVITSNHTLKELGENGLYDARILDRLACGTPIIFEGASRRDKNRAVRVKA